MREDQEGVWEVTDSEKLMTAALWIDKMFPNDPNPEVQTDLRRIAVRMVDIERELARVKEAAELLAKYIACLEEHSTDVSDVTDYGGISEVVKDNHKANVLAVNDADAAILAHPTAAALVEQARKEKQ